VRQGKDGEARHGKTRQAIVTPTVIAEAINVAWKRFLTASRRPVTPHASVYASAFRACSRRMTLELTQPDQQPPFDAEVLAKFRRGDDRERDLLVDLTRIGRDADPPFVVHGQQERFVLKDHKGRAAITGKVDARLEIAGAHPPIEVKAWSPLVVDKLETFADVFENPWTSSGGYQLLSYLYGAAEPYGFLLLDRSGIPRLLPVELEPHLDRMEAFLVKAEHVLDHVAAGTLPPFTDDPIECRRCPFYGTICNPPISGRGAQVLSDPELEAAIARREVLKAAGKEFNDLDADIKQRLRGVESAVIGRFQITGHWGKYSRVELPADLKAKYTVSNPKGKFTLEITPL
jgi:hypothetical protein